MKGVQAKVQATGLRADGKQVSEQVKPLPGWFIGLRMFIPTDHREIAEPLSKPTRVSPLFAPAPFPASPRQWFLPELILPAG